MPDQHVPIFFDNNRKRWRLIVRLSAILGILMAIASTLFFVSLFVSPLLPHVPVFQTHRKPGNLLLRPPSLPRAIASTLKEHEKQSLYKEIEDTRLAREKIASVEPPPSRAVVAGFYVNWEDTGLNSLRQNADKLTHLMPEWLFLQKDGISINTDAGDPTKQPVVKDVLSICSLHHIPILPMIKNFDKNWEPKRLHTLLSHNEWHHTFAVNLRNQLSLHGYQGINLDFETIVPADKKNLTHLVKEIYLTLHPAGLLVTQDVQAVDLTAPEDYSFDLKELSKWNDFIVYMAYDQHEETHYAGPISSINWFDQQWKYATNLIPEDKMVLAFGNYSYDWTIGDLPASDMTYQQSLVVASDNNDKTPVSNLIKIDPDSLNPTYKYEDEEGNKHIVWMMDATTCFNEWNIARYDQPRGAALWYLGSEDPSIWSFFNKATFDDKPDYTQLQTITFPYEIDYQGEGEILQVLAQPTIGTRSLTYDPKLEMITALSYKQLPSSYVIERSGKQSKMIALTFDDGPDPTWTPKVLDILHEFNVPATFFIVGENGEKYPGLVRQEWDEGHEIGNHTYTHPNLSETSDKRTQLELNSTQRVIESITGHSTLEFRAPYNADSEPRTAAEVKPLLVASLAGSLDTRQRQVSYFTVGESIDPTDWDIYKRGINDEILRGSDNQPNLRTAQDIANDTINAARAGQGNIVLLHDAGGDRHLTVEALPIIIQTLRAEGFQFVTPSQLVGKNIRALNPKMDIRERSMVGFEGVMFEIKYAFDRFLYWSFIIAICLGISRIVITSILAFVQSVRSSRLSYSNINSENPALVSIIIAAYNEEKVIARTVESVLSSDWKNIEIIIVDDGSNDGTAEVVISIFAANPRVFVIRQPNAGKANALNHGLKYAKGEIIVSLDADTLFTPSTISLLARHFQNEKVGAVAGNVKVGNRLNILTKWQALEYISSQNLDRRAYSLLNAITVVPGAVGAWRRSAIVEAGGYTRDTLAEDTDLTWKIRRAGWKLDTDSTAIAFTEAPDTLKSLFQQRFRWTFGTLQCLWKHKKSLGRNQWFGWMALPFLWIYQIFFQVLSPLIDLQVIISVVTTLMAIAHSHAQKEVAWSSIAVTNLSKIGFYYGLFFVVELIGGILAFKLDKERPGLLWWLFLQRFVYRQLMYAVVFKSIINALRGGGVGWGKLERKNTAKIDVEKEVVPG